jgi:hypothetical protein
MAKTLPQKVLEESAMPQERVQKRLQTLRNKSAGLSLSTFDSIEDSIVDAAAENFSLQKARKELGVK